MGGGRGGDGPRPDGWVHRQDGASDEVKIEIDAFNKQVITEPFNNAVCGELAKHLDPDGEAKTIIFCVDDDHADLVVKALKAAMPHADDASIRKLTGASDKPLQQILYFKNERTPNIAVTVDLLTTGIDVPKVSNIVFLRRVRSRILYEQMLGRATRLCPDIGKTHFRIFDAVDLYAALEKKTDMRPVVVNPSVTFQQLISELAKAVEPADRTFIINQLVAKLQVRKTLLRGEPMETFKTHAKIDLDALIKALKQEDPGAGLAVFAQAPGLAKFLDEVEVPREGVFISQHPDQILEVTEGYGKHTKPEAYLEEFAAYLKKNLNEFPALLVVATRPRELTRQQLRELRAKLDGDGFPESVLDAAWRKSTNQDVVASIIGHVRRAALGDPLVPYAERVDRAMKTILGREEWTAPQRGWLEAIAKQLKVEVVVDAVALDQGAFKTRGGRARANAIFGGRIDTILAEIQDAVWAKDSA